MTLDPLKEPRFGDIFVWRDGVIEFDVLYLRRDGVEGEFIGIELDRSALAAHQPNLFATIRAQEWAFVESIRPSAEAWVGIDIYAVVDSLWGKPIPLVFAKATGIGGES